MSTEEIGKVEKPKAARKPRKKVTKAAGPVHQAEKQTVGIRKTRLMQLAEGYGDSGLLNPRSIDPIVYMLAQMGESAFGKSVIDNCQDSIALSNTGFNKQKALGYLADRMVRKYLSDEFTSIGKREMSRDLSRLPVLSEASYVDYFMTVAKLEKEAFRTPIAMAAADMVRLITGYQTEQPIQVCEAIINFFRITKNQEGFEEILKDFCVLAKHVPARK